ncbi:hypothetical protein O181_012517 [Austropuccinia psidii MF-1]|uniref:Uncharacterized protein n=1 Tax=Austropuccinia psidii MF-1 TaxID=1389203 RepID=A0A9Q3BXV3_9BASI|nr:hypothetical protein [Austropuccinia psidii MF-1]
MDPGRRRFQDGPMLEGSFLLVVGQLNPASEGSEKLYCKEVEVLNSFICHSSSTSPTQIPAKKFQSQVIPSTPRSFQSILFILPYLVPPPSPKSFTSRPFLASPMKQSPIPQPRKLLVLALQQLKPVVRNSRRRDYKSPLPFPDTQVFHRRECWPIRVTREDQNVVIEGQDAVARFFGRADINRSKVMMYSDDSMITGASCEEISSKFAWYEAEFIYDFQRDFDKIGKDS